jgi:hypothetical protein
MLRMKLRNYRASGVSANDNYKMELGDNNGINWPGIADPNQCFNANQLDSMGAGRFFTGCGLEPRAFARGAR